MVNSVPINLIYGFAMVRVGVQRRNLRRSHAAGFEAGGGGLESRKEADQAVIE
jgi:hypothetical protein